MTVQTGSNSSDTVRPIVQLTKFISISIDIADSTVIKERLATFAAKWGLATSLAHEEFARGLIATEKLFLDLLIAENEAAQINQQPCAYELDRLFLIKAIGDEWWYSYSLQDLNDFDVAQHARHLLRALLAVLSKSPAIVFLPSAPIVHPDGLDEFDDTMRLELPLKITCDLIEGFDIGPGRVPAISPIVARCCGKGPITAGDELFKKLMGNLAAIPMITNHATGKVASIVRSDFVGIEVDRFFRLTDHSSKGRVLVGKQLFDVLDFADTPSTAFSLRNAWKCASLRHEVLGGGFTTLQSNIFVSLHDYVLKSFNEPYMAALCTDDYSFSGTRVAIRHSALGNAEA
ncbi:MAG: hypothetical protein HY847_10625 [Betaproteobacteria bacterium]|nr:hypothetical protein [Betaproteobacteria bacterium]